MFGVLSENAGCAQQMMVFMGGALNTVRTVRVNFEDAGILDFSF